MLRFAWDLVCHFLTQRKKFALSALLSGLHCGLNYAVEFIFKELGDGHVLSEHCMMEFNRVIIYAISLSFCGYGAALAGYVYSPFVNHVLGILPIPVSNSPEFIRVWIIKLLSAIFVLCTWPFIYSPTHSIMSLSYHFVYFGFTVQILPRMISFR